MAKVINSGTIINTDYNFAKLIDRSIENVVIPSSAKLIGNYAFNGFTQLKRVYVPKNVKSIGTCAFQNATLLEEITFEDYGITSIGQYAFQYCDSLEVVKLPVGLITIGTQTFSNMAMLKKLIIPSTAGNIGSFQTKNSIALTYIILEGDNPITYADETLLGGINLRLFDMRNVLSAKDKTSATDFTADNVYLYINVPDSLYSQFTALPNWNALKLKRWVHSCDVSTFEEIENPIDGDYYSLKGDTNYLNPVGEKQIDIRQYVNGAWVEVDIDA